MMRTQATPPDRPSPAFLTAFKAVETENRQLKTFINWEDDLFSNPHISGNHKLEIRATRRAVQRAQTRDEAGRARINLKTIAQQIGISPDTMSRGLKFLEQCGVIADHDMKKEIQENGEQYPRHYITLNEELIEQRPQEIKPPQPRNHGGQRFYCQKCGSDQVRIKKKITLVCKCGHESTIEETEREQEPVEPLNQAQQDQQGHEPPGRNLPNVLKPDTPPYAATCDDASDRDEPANPEADFQAAAQLLLALAGQADDHIEMSPRGEKKYYQVNRSLTLGDLRGHLQGGKARGARCQYPNNQTRGQCFDADDAERWQILEQAARQLAEAGYLPLLEPSPAREVGGHLWVIYDDLVDTAAARQHVLTIAPQLAEIGEYWPGPAGTTKWNRVRLPGGKYKRPGIDAWCQLIAVATGETSQDGASATKLLLANQTPASIVPPAARENQDDQELEAPFPVPAGGASDLPNDSNQIESNLRHGQVDPYWYERYNTQEGRRLWFAWTPAQLAAWWNNRHSIEELAPRERNGAILAVWRGERTASVAIDKTGEKWADFGASARQSNGSPDTGDALELAARLNGERGRKPETMRQASRELQSQAREALESAATNGQPIPAWLEEIITEAGRARYQQLRTQAGYVDQTQAPEPVESQANEHQGGVTGFLFAPDTYEQSNLYPSTEQRQLQEKALAVPSPLQDATEALAAEIDAEIGEPCQQCGCRLYYQSENFSMCHQCYPRPAKLGRLSDEQWARLGTLFPPKPLKKSSNTGIMRQR